MKDMYRGDKKTYTLSFLKADGITPQPITGWKIYFTMKQQENQSDAQAAIKVDVTEHDELNIGKTSICLSSKQTEKLIPGKYYYDIQVKKAEDDILTITSGQINVLADVTRRTD